MSKSLNRVRAALEDADLPVDIREVDVARTAQDAAASVGCHIDQIVKSIIFQVADREEVVLFLTAGGNQVEARKASACAGAPLGKADAGLIRQQTGFAIGGVAPIGHLNPIRAWMDPKLLEFDSLWAAAGTPRHLFAVDPAILMKISHAQVYEFTS
ncbi:YbaK/EbsC family protein [Marivita sp. S2033]|uniref:YbaK/EbsC family protein n=1 Tax=Marivita sp. S2033 TaxID=3373187 RepID=UPI0039828AF5